MRLDKNVILSYYNFNSLSSDIIELAKEILPDKTIYINFLNNEQQITMKVSHHDTDIKVSEGDVIPVENAICNMIDYQNNIPLVLEDIRNNNFTEEVKNTIKESNLGSYLGVPILFKDGTRFGALCAAHHDSSSFDDNDIALLVKIANLFSYYLELERQAHIDSLTGLTNLRFLTIQEDEITSSGGLLVMLDLDNFKAINDVLGHQVGDLVLKETAYKLNKHFSNFKHFNVIRLGGDEFFVYVKDKLTFNKSKELLKELNTKLTKWETNIKGINLSASIGGYLFEGSLDNVFEKLYQRVDSILYEAKNAGKSRFVLKES